MIQNSLRYEGLLISPPFEVCWLSADDLLGPPAALKKIGTTGCLIQFECKAETVRLPTMHTLHAISHCSPPTKDATIIFASKPGRRIQHEDNLTIIFGSHRNSQLKIELNGKTVSTAHCSQNTPGSSISSRRFMSFWAQLHWSQGLSVTIGHDRPSCENISKEWLTCDESASRLFQQDIHIGLASWDRHVVYRSIRLDQPLPFISPHRNAEDSPSPYGSNAYPSLIPTLFQTLLGCLSEWVKSSLVSPFAVIGTAELLSSHPTLYVTCLDLISRTLSLDTSRENITALSKSSLISILESDSVCISEKKIFDLAISWAEARTTGMDKRGVESHSVVLVDMLEKIITPEQLTTAYLKAAHLSETRIELPPTTPTSFCIHQPASSQLTTLSTDSQICYECLLIKEGQMLANEEAEDVLLAIRWDNMTPTDMIKVLSTPLVLRNRRILHQIGRSIQTDGLPLILRGRRSMEIVRAPQDSQGRRHDNALSDSSRNRTRRKVQGAVECFFVSAGDGNGVVRFIGSEGGNEGFINPQLTRKVTMTASSPPSKSTDTKVITDCRPAHSNSAGQRIGKDGGYESWWRLNLEGWRLIVNHYSLRADGSSPFISDWDFQALAGMEEGQEVWVSLRSHRSDRTISRPGQFAAWTVLGPFASVPYQNFRWISRGCKGISFPLSCIELYGYLFPPASSICISD